MLSFRTAVKEDIPFILSVRNKESTRKWLHNTSKFSIEEGYKWFEETNPIMFILLKDDLEVGYFRTSDWDSSSVCVGMDIHPYHRGKGYATKFYNTILEYLQSNYSISKFWLKVFKDNEVAVNLYRKLNFYTVKEGYNGDRLEITMERKGISFDDFQVACLRTANNTSDIPAPLNWALGITGEAGEYAELIKKKYFHGKEPSLDDLKKELGDILYYVAVAASDCGLGLEEIAMANVEKLRKRYPEGFVFGGGIRND